MTTVDFANKYLYELLTIAQREIYVVPDAEAHKAFTVGKTPKGKIWFSGDKGVEAAGYGLCLSADEMYINPQKELAAAVSSCFKLTVFDRIDFIKGQIGLAPSLYGTIILSYIENEGGAAY